MSVCHIVPVPGGECCDFCTEGPIFGFYRCANFVVKDRAVFHESKDHGVWASCRWCAELVDAERWSSLSERALRKFLKRHPVPRHDVPILWAQFTEIVRLFSEHQIKDVSPERDNQHETAWPEIQ